MAATNSLDRVWDALDRGGWKPNRRANTFKALCPVHGDANPSLSVRYDPQAGKIALHCFGCEASAADITAQLGLTVSDLFDAPLPADRRTHTRTLILLTGTFRSLPGTLGFFISTFVFLISTLIFFTRTRVFLTRALVFSTGA